MDILCVLCAEVSYLCCICCLTSKEEQGYTTQSPLSEIPPKQIRADSMYSVDLDHTGSPKFPSETDPSIRKQIGFGVV